MKLSLRALLLWVAFAALVAAALARPSLLWTRLMFTCTIVFLIWAVIGALATRGQQRVFWIGAAAFGLGYGLLFSGSRPSPYGVDGGFEMGRVVVTQQVLEWTAGAIGHEDPMQSNRATVWDPSILWQQRNTPLPATVYWAPTAPPTYSSPPQVSYRVVEEIPSLEITPGATDAVVQEAPADSTGDGEPPTDALDTVPALVSPPPPSMAYPSIPPYAAYSPYANVAGPASPGLYGQFLMSGHCAFLILIAVIGGALARWSFGREEPRG
jgi:hypothetical protein